VTGFLVAFLLLLVFASVLFFSGKFRLPDLPHYALISVFLLKCLISVLFHWLPDLSIESFELYKGNNLFVQSGTLYNLAFSNTHDFMMLVSGLASDSPYYDSILRTIPDWRNTSVGLDLFGLSHRSVIQLHTMLRFISGDSVLIQFIVLNFIQILVLSALFKRIAGLVPGKEKWFFFALFLLPLSWIFATDFNTNVSITGTSLLVLLFVQLIFFTRSPAGFIFKSLTVVALAPVFPIAFSACVFATAGLLPGILKKSRSSSYHMMAASMLCLFLFLGGDALLNKKRIVQTLITAQQEHQGDFTTSGPNMQELKPVWWSFARNLPEALFSGAMRPGLLDASGGFEWINAIGSALVFVLALLTVGLYSPPVHRDEGRLRYFLLALCTFFLLVVGYSSTLWVEIVTRRTLIMPFAILALLIFIDTKRLKAIFADIFNLHGNDTDNGSNIGNR
jgi:hypothetical protein